MKPILLLTLLLLTQAQAARTILIEEPFAYADGPLQDQGAWSRGVTSPSADNPSNHLLVSNGVLRFDWTTHTPINNALRWQWEETLYEGWIYADFTITVAQAPSSGNAETRPTFIHFDRSGGSQMRGHVGLREGPEPGTFQVGISPSSQAYADFLFAENVLAENVPQRVRVGYDIQTAETWLWINAEGETTAPAVMATGNPGTNVRRIQFKMRNADASSDGISNLGIFTVDDLLVYTDDAPGSTNGPDTPVVILLGETFAYEEDAVLGAHSVWSVSQGDPRVVVRQNVAYPFDGPSGSGGSVHRPFASIPEGEVAFGLTLRTPAVSSTVLPTNIAALSRIAGGASSAVLALQFNAGRWSLGLRTAADTPVTWAAAAVPDGGSSRWIVTFDPATGSTRLYDDTNALQVEPVLSIAASPALVDAITLFASGDKALEGFQLKDLHVTSSRHSALALPTDRVTPPPPEKFFLFLLAGQSNMAGRGEVAPEDLIGSRRILTFNEDREWVVARDPLHWDRPGFNGVGPALSFARKLLESLPEDAVIGLIPAAQGGTSLSWWQKDYSGTNLYYGGQRLFDNAVARSLEAIKDGTISAILWNQGESDAGSAENDNGSAYRTLLHTLIADLRSELGNRELPFIAATLGTWRTNATALNAVYLELPATINHTAVVNTNNPAVAPALLNNPNDTPHYLSPSYRLLGQLYASAYMPFLPASPDPLPWEANGLSAGQTGQSPWFGTFTKSTEGWIDHALLGWINVNAVAEQGNLWLFSLIRNNWVWSSDIFFPILYDFRTSDWIYFAHYKDYGTHLYSFGSDQWTWELAGD